MRFLVIFVVMTLALNPAHAASGADKLRAKAADLTTAGKTSEAIAAYQTLLSLEPDDGSAHYRLASLLMDDNQLGSAATHFKKAAAAGFQPLGVAYRLARIYARRGETANALAELDKLAAGGFGMISLIEDEPDFDSIKTEPRFSQVVTTIRAARFPCEADPRHRAFDFWIGQWRVTQNGQFAGTNNIQSIMGGCTLFEQWTSANGGLGKSFNYYDPAHDHWRQIWIADSGTFIEFTGQARDGGIFYTAETRATPDADMTYHKFEFTQNEDGSVRQFWQTSSDKKTWSTIWDGRYERVDPE